MRWWLLLLTIALSGAGCATSTTAGSFANGGAQPRLAENAPSEVAAEPPDRAPDAPTVVVQASSPTDVQFGAGASDVVVPLTPRQPTAVHRRTVGQQAKWFGAGIGVLAGALIGHDRDEYARAHPDANCDPFACGDNLLIDSLAFGLMGLGVGAAVGAITDWLGSP